MSEIRAFVGYSFAKEDEALVGSFLRHFSTLQKSPLGFSWVSAEPAEPVELSAKVLKLMEGTNVFVGICTKKQRSVSPLDLLPTKFPPGYLKAGSEKFLWKTSDWIIQEIGLAIGRGLTPILLLETGVERPGELQGNIEYIEFDRDNPEGCFDKILEMITTLLPTEASGTLPSPADPRSAPEVQKAVSEQPETTEWWKPDPSWTQRDYDMTLRNLIAMGDEARIPELNGEYAQSSLIQIEGRSARWQALTAYYQLVFGTNGTIARLRELVATNPGNCSVQEQLARGLAHIGEDQRAAEVFETAAEKAVDTGEKVRLLGQSSLAFTKAKLETEATRILVKMRAEVETDPGTEPRILRSLAELAKQAGSLDEEIAVLERYVEINPDEHDARFSLAYAHSERSNDALALFHYTKIPQHERNGTTWNNIGVSSDQLGLPAQAVDAYKTSISMNETLAMSNLAAKWLKAGFLTEAIDQCEQAMKLSDVNRNVLLTLSDAKAKGDKESTQFEKITAGATPTSNFYREFGRALTRSQPEILSPTWVAPEAEVTVTIKGNTFIAEGIYEITGLAGLLLPQHGVFGSPAPPQKYRVVYQGTLNGRTVHGTVTRRLGNSTTPTSFLADYSDRPEVLMFLTDDATEFHVMERTSAKAASFFSMHRKIT